MPALSWTLALLVGLSSCGLRAVAQDGEKVYQRVIKSVAWVVVPLERKGNRVVISSGSGSLVDARHKIVLTNYHVVGDRDEAIVLFPVSQKGKMISEKDFYRKAASTLGIHGRVIARDKLHDLALIELPSLPEGVLPIRLSAKGASPGQEVHSIGNPGRSSALWLYTNGRVRQVSHQRWTSRAGDRVLEFDSEVVETQSPINAGDSGGPLVNSHSELVGVTHGTAVDASELSLFIDVSEVRRFLASKKLLARSPAPAVDHNETGAATENKPAENVELQERKAASKLKLVRQLIESGKKDRAIERLGELIKEYPKTKAAEEAKALLLELSK
jgi:S1-C subfamily serine protease